MAKHDPEAFKKELHRFTVVESIPLHKLEGETFKRVARSLRIQAIAALPTCHTETPGKIYITFNLWISPRIRSINGIVDYFVDKKGRNRTALLALSEMDNAHNSAYIC
ncbi:hypothetical protein K469DRAFT_686814 [Zopfia rhizophila CBS 207.26]|uniref:Uncharacterized protein n=1 Tax=Zopfia rhizophila CBS 207.26 TaxID=1314779 RepID=A0A6A6EVS6_9PEZI|nr:hypothetical protein K469DRAFT_686814 [Zopfia rhizophila CBS 207.26]